MSLAQYDVDPVTGFVPREEPVRALPAPFDAWDALLPAFPALIRSRQLRAALRRLPVLSADDLRGPAETQRAMMLFCHFANAWVWGDVEPDLRIPAPIAVPLCALSERLRRPPIAHYASMTLTNWQLIDPALPLSIDNARTQVQFLGGVDEDWFFIASMGVELAGAPLLAITAETVNTSVNGSDDELATELGAFIDGMRAVHASLHRIREWCDPATYYLRVRPYVTGWPAPGVIYDGVSETPRKLLGGSAAQSSLLQSFDAMLGLAHPDNPAGGYLRTVRNYMPPLHRSFVEDMERDSRVRERVQTGAAHLRTAYNAAIEEIRLFRDAHMQLAHDFILRPSGSMSDAKGTGGTALTAFLGGARDTTAAARL